MSAKSWGNSPVKNMSWQQWAGIAVCGCVLFSCLLLNWQPWLDLGSNLSEKIVRFPFLSFLFWIPLGIGGLFKLLLGNLGQVVGLSLWALAQYFQVLPLWLLANNKPVSEKIWWYYGFSYLGEVLVCFGYIPPYVGGVGSLLQDLPRPDWYLIDWPNAGMLLATIGSFEAIVGVAIEISKGK